MRDLNGKTLMLVFAGAVITGLGYGIGSKLAERWMNRNNPSSHTSIAYQPATKQAPTPEPKSPYEDLLPEYDPFLGTII